MKKWAWLPSHQSQKKACIWCLNTIMMPSHHSLIWDLFWWSQPTKSTKAVSAPWGACWAIPEFIIVWKTWKLLPSEEAMTGCHPSMWRNHWSVRKTSNNHSTSPPMFFQTVMEVHQKAVFCWTVTMTPQQTTVSDFHFKKWLNHFLNLVASFKMWHPFFKFH